MSETIERYLKLLQHIPAKGKITVAELASRVGESHLSDVARRTIERNLNTLATVAPIVGDGGKPQGWSWVKGSTPMRFPAVSLAEALSTHLVDAYLSRLLPRPVYEHLQAQADHARSVLKTRDDSIWNWSRRVELVYMGPERLKPTIDTAVVNAVYEALLENRQIRIDYRGASSSEYRRSDLHPQALVVMDEVLYLVASYGDDAGPYQFALHRMCQATVLDDKAEPLPNFDLDDYLHAQRGFQYADGRTVTLELSVGAFLRRQLEERPLSENQRIATMAGGERHRVVARLALTEQLKWWLRSWGSELEVLKPVALRRAFAADVRALAGRYANESSIPA